MFYVYILKLNNKTLYVGRSQKLKRRYKEHSTGKVASTANFRPVRLIHYEAFLAKEDAIRREKHLKTSTGKRMLKLMLKETIKID